MPRERRAEIAIIGGSGIYELGAIRDVTRVKVHTPYGRPSDAVTLGVIAGQEVAFLPRHGPSHEIPPHQINARANLWALKSLGVTRIISPSAVGSLREDHRPGDLVVVDQFIDRTKDRPDTFYEGGQVCHISSADPFCKDLCRLFTENANEIGLRSHAKGTYVCVQGPRFSTRAESRMFRQWGADVIGMTLYPECVLARELEICYVSLAMITDYDVWADKPVSTEEILRVMGENVANIRSLIEKTIPEIPASRDCECSRALSNALV